MNDVCKDPDKSWNKNFRFRLSAIIFAKIYFVFVKISERKLTKM
jgi:hypothetical protein